MVENYYPIVFEEGSFTILNSGTAPTPCKITITPKISFVILTIEGVSEKPISVSSLSANDVLVIDGETRQVLINDAPAMDRYNGWEFPKLQPGENVISIVNGNHIDLSIEYSARYL